MIKTWADSIISILRAVAICILVCSTTSSYGQKGKPVEIKTTAMKKGQDSLQLYVADRASFWQKNAFVDTIGTYNSSSYYPVWSDSRFLVDLGRPGSPVQNLNLNYRSGPHFLFNYDGREVYRKRKESLTYFLSKIAYARAKYVQGSSQTDAFFEGTFGRTFDDNLHFTIDYNRIPYEGIYYNQSLSNTNVATGLWWDNGRHQTFVDFDSNVFAQFENGGVQSFDDVISGEYSRQIGIPVELQATQTRTDEKSASISHYYQLKNEHSNAMVGITMGYKRSYDKYADEQVPTAFYQGQLADSTKVGFHWRNNTFDIGTDYIWQAKRLELKSSLRYLRHQLEETSYSKTFAEWQWNNHLAYKANSWSSKLDVASSYFDDQLFYKVDLSTRYQWRKNLDLMLSGQLHRNPRPFVDTYRLASGNAFFSDEQLAMREAVLEGGVGFGDMVSFRVSYVNGQNRSYWTSDLTQTAIPSYQIFQLGLRSKLGWRSFNLKTNLLYQTMDADDYPIPKWLLKADVYYRQAIFKDRLDLRVGVVGEYIDRHRQYGYFPLYNTWYVSDQNRSNIGAFHPYFSFRVTQFDFFLRAQNIQQLIRSKSVNEYVHKHPNGDFYLRFGITWAFRG